MDEFFGDNNIEDVRWLCSLSESELDLLVSLKRMVIQRAKILGYEGLASKFDLKILRALGLVLMEHLKGNIKNLTYISDVAKSATFMDDCSLLQHKLGELVSIEELKSCISIDEKKKQAAKRPREEVAE